MRVGINHTPSQGWFHSWLDLDLDAVRRDFEQIAGIGLDHVRIFPLWPLLQPNRGLVRPRAVEDVLAVARVAGEFGLTVSVDALNGHLSSFDFLPSWVVTWHEANLFTDPVVRAGQTDLVAQLATRLREEPNVDGMTLGNEFPQYAALAPGHAHPTRSACTVQEADAWLDEMFDALERAWPGARGWFGFDDDLWFVDDHPFVPRQAVTRGATTTVHSWVFAQVGPRYGAGHPALTWFPRYLLELTRAWCPDPTRGLWLQEVGAPRTHVPDESAADFLTATLRAVAPTPGLEAVTWWCSHDVDPALLDFPTLEYSLGLFTHDGHAKPEAHALAEMIPDLRATGQPPTSAGDESGESGTGAGSGVGGPEELTFRADWHSGQGRSVCSPTGELFARWLDEATTTGRAPRLRRRGD